MWRVKTVTKLKNSFSPILIYWNDNRIHLGIIKKLKFPIWFPPLMRVGLKLNPKSILLLQVCWNSRGDKVGASASDGTVFVLDLRK